MRFLGILQSHMFIVHRLTSFRQLLLYFILNKIFTIISRCMIYNERMCLEDLQDLHKQNLERILILEVYEYMAPLTHLTVTHLLTF